MPVQALSRSKPARLLAVFDALRDGGEIHTCAHLQDGRRQRRILFVGDDPVEESLVDLEDIDRQVPQVGQGTVAGTKIVDGDPDARIRAAW